jgi:hypothetical protein
VHWLVKEMYDTVIILRFPQSERDFLTSLGTASFLGTTVLSEVSKLVS